MQINQTVNQVHGMAKEKGWHDKERRPLEIHALITSEVAEATEAVRNNEDHFWITAGGKPQGEATELADVVIRIFDYFGLNGWDMEHILQSKIEYNNSRPYRHGGKTV